MNQPSACFGPHSGNLSLRIAKHQESFFLFVQPGVRSRAMWDRLTASPAGCANSRQRDPVSIPDGPCSRKRLRAHAAGVAVKRLVSRHTRAAYAVLPGACVFLVAALFVHDAAVISALRTMFNRLISVVRQSRLAPFCFALYSFFTIGEAYGQFMTVYNVPPDEAPPSIGSDTQLNLFDGGVVGNDFDAAAFNGTSTNVEVNIFGGSVGRRFDAFTGSTVNISFGSVGNDFEAFDGSTVNISGGSVGAYFNANLGSVVNISSFARVGFGFGANSGSTVNISGGLVGNSFDASFGATVNISGGMVGSSFDALVGSTVNIFCAGSVGDNFNAYDGSTVNISGGSVRDDFDAFDGSTVNISGGSVGDNFNAYNGSTVNISGGSVGVDFDAGAGSEVNLFGAQFVLDGIDITDSLRLNEPVTIEGRDVALRGLLADGSAFAFNLNSDNQSGEDYFHRDATLTVTLAPRQPGDTDGDGDVDIVDLNNVRNNFGAMCAEDCTLAACTLPGDAFPFDGMVNIVDLNAVRNNFGTGASPTTVPEPQTILMAGLGLFALLGHRPLRPVRGDVSTTGSRTT